MDGQDGVGLGIVWVCDALDDQEETDGARLPICVLICFLSLEVVLHCLGTFSEGHILYLWLVLSVLMDSLGVSIDLLSKDELGHLLIYVCSCVWDRNFDVLLVLYWNPDVLGIGALAPGIDCQGLVGCGELVGLVSGPHVINVTLEVLCYPTESNSC